MPLLPPANNSPAPKKDPTPPEKVAAIAKAREAQADWANLREECRGTLDSIKEELGATQRVLSALRNELRQAPYRLSRLERKTLANAVLALTHVDAAVRRIAARDAADARREERAAATRNKGGRPKGSRTGSTAPTCEPRV